jgi:mannose-1-phosphate guanylyltransferase
MAAIGLAAAQLELEDPEALIGSFAADHVITDESAFAACVGEAAEVAAGGLLVTIGIEPTHAATGFGYVRGGDALPGFPTARVVTEFVEKPDAQRAEAYVRSGAYRWNAGMFVARASTLLDLLAGQHPELAAGLRAVAADPASLGERWPGFTRIAIDHAVAEPAAAAGRVAMVPGPFGWEDVGDFAGLAELTADRPEGLKVLGEESLVVSVDASGLVVPHGGRTVAVLGLDDVVVVDTGDALLVTSYARAQDVKAVVDELRRRGRDDLT